MNLQQTLLSINVILAKITACLSKRHNISPSLFRCSKRVPFHGIGCLLMTNSAFWPQAFIEHLSFTSSFQHDATVTALLTKELATLSDTERQAVRKILQKSLIYSVSEIKFNQGMSTFPILSSLLKQMQCDRLFGRQGVVQQTKYSTVNRTEMDIEWYEAMQASVHRTPRLPALTDAFEIISIFRALYSTSAEDSPVAFVCSSNQ